MRTPVADSSRPTVTGAPPRRRRVDADRPAASPPAPAQPRGSAHVLAFPGPLRGLRPMCPRSPSRSVPPPARRASRAGPFEGHGFSGLAATKEPAIPIDPHVCFIGHMGSSGNPLLLVCRFGLNLTDSVCGRWKLRRQCKLFATHFFCREAGRPGHLAIHLNSLLGHRWLHRVLFVILQETTKSVGVVTDTDWFSIFFPPATVRYKIVIGPKKIMKMKNDPRRCATVWAEPGGLKPGPGPGVLCDDPVGGAGGADGAVDAP